MTVRTRFAPSPTGYLHIGGVRTALFCWLFARHHGGQFILRIDDTDQQRNLAVALEPILSGLRWLGIQWDEGPEVGGPCAPYFQSQRTELYQQAVDRLLASGCAYRDYARAEEIDAERQEALKRREPFVYSRRFAAWTPEEQQRFEAQGRQAVVRLKMLREGKLVLDDLVRGRVEFDWAQEQDHVIQRADGSCLYHLASVVDDHQMQITHVIRAEEHLSNTPRQVFIARSLGYQPPQYAHVPYVAAPGGRAKLSKRKLHEYLKQRDFAELVDHARAIVEHLGESFDTETCNPVVVDFYRRVGYLPEALVNYLALLGWSWDDRAEHFTREELVQRFTLDRVNRAPAALDPKKLQAFESRHFQQIPLQRKVELVRPFLERAGLLPAFSEARLGEPLQEKLEAILRAAGDRVRVAGDVLNFPEFFVDDEQLVYEEKAFKKRIAARGAAELLARFRTRLAEAEPFEAETLQQTMEQFVEAEGIRIGQIIHAVRVAVTGRAVGLGMFETLAILGKEACLRRIDRALKLAAGA